MSDALTLPGWTHVYTGKVRDLYIPMSAQSLKDAQEILMVASDRVSAFDYKLSPPIPEKGKLLNQLTLWWLQQFPEVPNHVLSTDVPDAVVDRAIICKNLSMYPVECVVRGYMSGSAWAEYEETSQVCGITLPPGIRFGERLPQPIFTPAFKAPEGQHDQNITFDQTVELVGEQVAEALRETSLAVFTKASEIAESKGLILADTKFEFGSDLGRLTIADEVLTSDSSRYWDHPAWAAGESQLSFDKQIIRDWLSENWDRTGAPPELPPELVALTGEQYRVLFERLTS